MHDETISYLKDFMSAFPMFFKKASFVCYFNISAAW